MSDFYAPPSHTQAQDELDPLLSQYGYEPNKEVIRWPHYVAASLLLFHGVLELVSFAAGDTPNFITLLIDFGLGAGIISGKYAYVNYAHWRAGLFVVITGPMAAFREDIFTAGFYILLGGAIFLLVFRQPGLVRAIIGTTIGGLLFLLGLIGIVAILIGIE